MMPSVASAVEARCGGGCSFLLPPTPAIEAAAAGVIVRTRSLPFMNRCPSYEVYTVRSRSTAYYSIRNSALLASIYSSVDRSTIIVNSLGTRINLLPRSITTLSPPLFRLSTRRGFNPLSMVANIDNYRTHKLVQVQSSKHS